MKNSNKKDTYGFIFKVLLLLYPISAVFTPELDTLDSNTSKFLSISVLNVVVSLTLILKRKTPDSNRFFPHFFFSKVGSLYTAFLFICLLSFVKSINIGESVIMTAKIGAIFTSTYLIYKLIRLCKEGGKILIQALILLLLFDSVYVLYQSTQYISGHLSSIITVKGVYSHKNILAASIFIKMVFALYVLTYYQGIWKKIGITSLLLGTLSLLVLSTRGFYIGLALLSVVFFIICLSIYRTTKEKRQLSGAFIFLGILVISILGYTLVQNFLYPRVNPKKDLYNNDLVSRMGTISEDHGGERLDSWKRSYKLFLDEPILGVGIGNWKVRVLEYANKINMDYVYHIKNHNDFIELFVETGLIGGALYLLIFLVVFFYFLNAFLLKKDLNRIRLLFIPVLGLMCYAVDSFFNFPIDRPEISILFSIFLAHIGVYEGYGFGSQSHTDDQTKNSKVQLIIFNVLILFSLLSSYVLYLNYKSSQLQKVILEDVRFNKVPQSRSFFKKFPPIPTITSYGEPLIVSEAKYLFYEKKYQQVISILRNENPSPYDGRAQYLKAIAHKELGNLDSSAYYIDQALLLKPYFYRGIKFKSGLLEDSKKNDEAIQLLEFFLRKKKMNDKAWLHLSSLYEKNNIDKAIQTLDTALIYLNKFDKDITEIVSNKSRLENKKKVNKSPQNYNAAMEFYNQKDYVNAEIFFSRFIEAQPNMIKPYELRAFCYFTLKNYRKSIADFDFIEKEQSLNPTMHNIRGLCYYYLGDQSKACIDLRASKDSGNTDGINNFNAICQSNK